LYHRPAGLRRAQTGRGQRRFAQHRCGRHRLP
jgi:hypothetical protein